MGNFLCMGIAIGLMWAAAKLLGARAVERGAESAMRRTAKGIHHVGSDVIGGLAGPGAPDFGPPPVDGFTDESSTTLRIGAPPDPPEPTPD